MFHFSISQSFFQKDGMNISYSQRFLTFNQVIVKMSSKWLVCNKKLDNESVEIEDADFVALGRFEA